VQPIKLSLKKQVTMRREEMQQLMSSEDGQLLKPRRNSIESPSKLPIDMDSQEGGASRRTSKQMQSKMSLAPTDRLALPLTQPPKRDSVVSLQSNERKKSKLQLDHARGEQMKAFLSEDQKSAEWDSEEDDFVA